MLSFSESDTSALSSHEKSQAEDKSNTRRTAKPRKSQRKIQNPEEAILEEVVRTKFFPAILNSIFYYLQQKQPVQLNIFLPWFVLLTFLYYLTLLITFWDFFLLGLQPFTHLLLFKGIQHIHENKHADMDSTAHCCWFRLISPFPLITGLCDERGYPCTVPNPRANTFSFLLLMFSSIQFSYSVVSNSLRLHEPQHTRPPCPSPTPRVYSNSCPLNQWCHPTISSSVGPFSSCSQSFPASGNDESVLHIKCTSQNCTSNESVLYIKWPKYWSFSFTISPSNEHPGLICFRMDWLDLLAVQGTLKSLLQQHSSKTSILCSAFLIVQLSYPYTTSGKIIALTRWTIVDKVISLIFNMLSRLFITFLPRSTRLLISWLQSPSAVILEPRKIKSAIVSTAMKWWDRMPSS